ncbi:MAG: hypothetical protein JNK04_01615, partial [Myxococcales bacterium]|nr:hypothetical protein [Myxococcales bacterium]
MIATLLGAPACADSADTVAASERLPQAVEPVAEAAKEVRVSSKILDVRVPARLPDGFALANAGLGSRITLKYAGAQAAQAEPVGGGFHYRDALGPGFDVTVARSRSGIEDTVELPSAPPGGAIRYEIERVAGIAGFRTAHGTVELLDSFGTPAMRVGRATVIDAAGASHPIALTLRGCAAEDGGLPPWGRPVTEPGADRCVIEARMPEGLRYPARLDPTWEVTTSMNEYRYDVPAVLLPNGRVFVVGGRGEGAEVNAEVYDPDSETWTYVPSADLTTPAYDFTLTALQGGRLLLTGGEWDLPSSTIVANVRALNATTFVWSVVQSMAVPRSDHRATLLDDGRLLVSGGRDSNSASLASAEIFDPIANTWSTTGSLIEGRFLHEAVLHNGRVLVAGGLPPSNSSTNTSEIFDPTADGGVGAWVFPRIFFGSRYSHAMALLGDDRAIIFGGNVGSLTTASVQVYDFASNVWSSAPDLPLPGGVPGLMYGRAARALDGGVIFTGGCDGYQYCD